MTGKGQENLFDSVLIKFELVKRPIQLLKRGKTFNKYGKEIFKNDE